MKLIFALGWDRMHPQRALQAEDFITAWQSSEENNSYSSAVFYGVISGNSQAFAEIEEGEEAQLRDIQCHIRCNLVRGGREVHVSLLHY